MNAHFLRKLWDVSRPNSIVDKVFTKQYNIDVLKREIQKYLPKKKGKKEMRVTKLIREYVESSVREMYAPKIDACGADYKKKREE